MESAETTVRRVLTELSEDAVSSVIERLSQLGVRDESYMMFVREDHLTSVLPSVKLQTEKLLAAFKKTPRPPATLSMKAECSSDSTIPVKYELTKKKLIRLVFLTDTEYKLDFYTGNPELQITAVTINGVGLSQSQSGSTSYNWKPSGPVGKNPVRVHIEVSRGTLSASGDFLLPVKYYAGNEPKDWILNVSYTFHKCKLELLFDVDDGRVVFHKEIKIVKA